MPQVDKLFANHEGKASFTCPQCGRSKIFDVSAYIKTDKAVRFKCRCACGYKDLVLLERRKYYRKNIGLPGVYFLNKKEREKSDLSGIDFSYCKKGTGKKMEVVNLSRTGLQFRTNGIPEFDLGDVITVEFILDDKNRSLISKKVKIIHINGKDIIGADFFSPDSTDSSSTEINFYLFNT
jgi:c-di-GMP-binding flagellar brake protein YcgR